MADTHKEADDLLDDLMIENHITIKDVYNCAEQHEDEIKNMVNIFDLENDHDRLLVLTILRLLAGEHGKAVTDLYCRDYAIKNENYRENCAKEDIKLLLTACLYNRAFFSFAMRLYGDIEARLGRIAEKERIAPPEELMVINTVLFVKKWIIPYKRDIDAAPRGYVTFLKEEHMECNGICGTLELRKNKYNQVQCLFTFDEDKYQKKIPFVLEVQFTTKSDSKKHTITLNRFDKGNVITYIFSDIESGIDLSKGIEGDFTIMAKQPDAE